MNPGPYGMAQTGVPFGAVEVVRDWLGLEVPIGRPPQEHPGKPVLGFEGRRSEVSGRRLWGLFAARFGTAARFFEQHFVANYCPLLFLEGTPAGRNLPPDALKSDACTALFAACDSHLRALVQALDCQWAVGVGAFAEGRLRKVFEGTPLKIGRIPHPSPANPASNRGWDTTATEALQELGVWPSR
jgi:single-strand selective monofunctional uracil DNA glycosylase